MRRQSSTACYPATWKGSSVMQTRLRLDRRGLRLYVRAAGGVDEGRDGLREGFDLGRGHAREDRVEGSAACGGGVVQQLFALRGETDAHDATVVRVCPAPDQVLLLETVRETGQRCRPD